MEILLPIMRLDMHNENQKTQKYIIKTSYKLQTVIIASKPEHTKKPICSRAMQ